MPIQYQGSSIPTSFASCSFEAKSGGTLPEKLKAIRNAGFDAIELSMPDILEYGKTLNGEEPGEKDFDVIVKVAEQIRKLVEDLGLKILMLQPFSRFEGWKKGQHDKEKEDALERARGWIRIMEAVGTDMLQVGSSDAHGISSSFDDLARDLADLADLCAEKGFRIAYENWCWATHAPTWKAVLQIVQKANRPNLGLCLDTFQTAGLEYGDPTTASGLLEDVSPSELETRWKKSLSELAATVPADKIYLLQISDAYKAEPPLEAKELGDGNRPRSRWSHDYRPLPGHGGYLPVREMLQAVLDTGFRGYLSVEVFDWKQKDTTPMEEYTKAAMSSLEQLLS